MWCTRRGFCPISFDSSVMLQSRPSKDEESFQCPLTDTVDLGVLICPDTCCHPLVKVVVQFVLFSCLCCGATCPLQAPMGCCILHVHQGQLSTEEDWLTLVGLRTQPGDLGPAGYPAPGAFWVLKSRDNFLNFFYVLVKH